MQFSVYPMPERRPGLVVDVQSDLLSHLDRRAVIPLVARAKAPQTLIDPLNPIFDLNGSQFVLLTQGIANLAARFLAAPVGNLRNEQTSIIRAIDALLSGI